jgi:hypothetical protein
MLLNINALFVFGNRDKINETKKLTPPKIKDTMEGLYIALKRYERLGWFWNLKNEKDGYSMSISHTSWVTGVDYKHRPVPVFYGRDVKEVLERVVSTLEAMNK